MKYCIPIPLDIPHVSITSLPYHYPSDSVRIEKSTCMSVYYPSYVRHKSVYKTDNKGRNSGNKAMMRETLGKSLYNFHAIESEKNHLTSIKFT